MKIRKAFKYIMNALTALNVFVLVASVVALEANKGDWLPVWFALIAFIFLAVSEMLIGGLRK